MAGDSKRKSPRWLDGPHGVGAKCELRQQSIVKSTSLVATTERLDGNTRFSSQLYNRLIYNRLSKKEENRNFLLNLLRCKTCLTESRYMVFRASKHGLSRWGLVGIAKRKMPNGGRTAKNGDDKRKKTTISVAGSTKNATQLLHQNIRQNAPLYGRDGGTNILNQHRLLRRKASK